MARPKPTAEDLIKRERRAMEWKLFRRNHLFTQRRLADVLGLSRRTLQQIEAGNITPTEDTLRKFILFRRRYDR